MLAECKDLKIRVAKTNCVTRTIADSCELAPGTECDLVNYIDGRMESLLVRLDEGVTLGQRDVYYSVVAPF
jgi:hypothetical protein